VDLATALPYETAATLLGHLSGMPVGALGDSYEPAFWC
jgi:hypothetical protein